VGPRISATTLLFSNLRRPATPIDSHHHSVGQRLSLIGPKADKKVAYVLLANLLPPDWNARQVFDHHEALIFHGQKCCYYQAPTCGRCVVLTVVPVWPSPPRTGQMVHFCGHDDHFAPQGQARQPRQPAIDGPRRSRDRPPGRPAHSGQANAALQGLLAATFGLAKRNVELLADHTAPFEKMELAGLSDKNLTPALAKLGTSARA